MLKLVISESAPIQPNKLYAIKAANSVGLQYVCDTHLGHLRDASLFGNENDAIAHAKALLEKTKNWSEALKERLGVLEIVEVRVVTGKTITTLERVW